MSLLANALAKLPGGDRRLLFLRAGGVEVAGLEVSYLERDRLGFAPGKLRRLALLVPVSQRPPVMPSGPFNVLDAELRLVGPADGWRLVGSTETDAGLVLQLET